MVYLIENESTKTISEKLSSYILKEESNEDQLICVTLSDVPCSTIQNLLYEGAFYSAYNDIFYKYLKENKNITIEKEMFIDVRSNIESYSYSLILENPYYLVGPVSLDYKTGKFSIFDSNDTEISEEFKKEIENMVQIGVINIEDGEIIRKDTDYDGMCYTTFLNFLESNRTYLYNNRLFYFFNPEYLKKFKDVYIIFDKSNVIIIKNYLMVYDFEYREVSFYNENLTGEDRQSLIKQICSDICNKKGERI